MADLTYFMLSFALDPIENAYKSGTENLKAQHATAQRDYAELIRSAKVEGRNLYQLDEESGQSFDEGEHAYYKQVVIENALQSHRQAFAIMIHHIWEKHACYVLQVSEYQCNKAYGELVKHHGLPVDRPRLERLRMTANCIKHEDAELYQNHPEMFDVTELNLYDAGLTESARKNVWPAPFARGILKCSDQSASTYAVSWVTPWPRWTSARLEPQ